MRYGFKFKIQYLAVAFLVIASCLVISPPSTAKGCDDVKFIFARGSGEALNDVSSTAWRESIEAALQKSTLQYSFYELGTYAQGSYRYPAVSVSESLGGFGNLLGAYLSRGESFEFGKSVVQGIGELQTYLRVQASACPQTKFILGGYSQGAMVLSRTLGDLDADRILYVATFGDPKLYLPEGKGTIPPACLGRSYSDYRVYVPDCRAYEGILGSQRPYQPGEYTDKLGVWCNEKDIMCSSGLSVDDHTSYTSSGLYKNAAREIKTRLKRVFPNAFLNTTIEPWASAAHNVAFLFDTSVSMINAIGNYSKKAKTLAAEVAEAGGSVAVAEFRDLDDPYEPRVLCDFGCTQSEIDTQLGSLYTGGGGDDQESVLSGLLYAMNNLDWQIGAAKSIILFTDDEYLSPDRDGTTLSDVVQRSLEIDPVNVYVVTHPRHQDSYEELASRTGGETFDFNDADEWGRLTDLLLYRPEASLNAADFSGIVGDEFYFDVSASTASDGGSLLYDWDLDGDGEFEISNGPAEIYQVYDRPFSGYIQVKITDAESRSSTMSAKLTVTELAPRFPEIFDVTSEELTSNDYRIQYQTNAERILVAVDDTPVGHLDGAAQDFVLTDIIAPTTLRLIPYTSGIGRGESVTLELGQDLPMYPDSNLPSQEPILPQKPILPSTPSPMPTPESTQAPIPKAPNAGVAKASFTSASR